MLTINNVTLTANTARDDDGGGLGSEPGSTTTINDSTISNNTAGQLGVDGSPGDGGGIRNEGTMTISRSLIDNNSALGTLGVRGGGIYNTGVLRVEDSTVSNNTVSGTENEIYGGGIYGQSETVIIGSAIINNNATSLSEAEVGGGGIAYAPDFPFQDPLPEGLWLINSTVSGNSAAGADDVYGGGLLVFSNGEPGSATLINSTISDNSLTAPGGELWRRRRGVHRV